MSTSIPEEKLDAKEEKQPAKGEKKQEKDKKKVKGAGDARILCLSCEKIIVADDDEAAQCRCPVRATADPYNGCNVKNPLMAMMLDPNGFAHPLAKLDKPKVRDLTDMFKAVLLYEPLMVYNIKNDPIAIINPKNRADTIDSSTVDVRDYIFGGWPIPVVSVPPLDGLFKEKIKLDDPIFAPEILALRLKLMGYTNIMTPDTSQTSLYIKDGKPVGPRRLARFI